MKLLNDFYTLGELNRSADSIRIRVTLNPEHRIYAGHFPGHPVLPGVCMVQIVKEILEKVCQQNLLLHEAAELKFLNIISPKHTPSFHVELSIAEKEKNNFQVTGQFHDAGTTYFKLKGVFIPA